MQNTKVIYKELNLQNIKKISFLLIYAIFAFYFLVNGSGIFKEWNESWNISTLIYMAGVAVFLGIQEKLPKEFNKPLVQNINGFIASFIFATLLFIVIYDTGLYFTSITPLPLDQILALLTFQLVIVVASEEIIFRGVIFQYFTKYFNWVIGMLISAFCFSLFHLAVYEGSIGALMTAFIMGLIFAWATYRFNIGVAMGLHFAWNAFVLGATALL